MFSSLQTYLALHYDLISRGKEGKRMETSLIARRGRALFCHLGGGPCLSIASPLCSTLLLIAVSFLPLGGRNPGGREDYASTMVFRLTAATTCLLVLPGACLLCHAGRPWSPMPFAITTCCSTCADHIYPYMSSCSAEICTVRGGGGRLPAHACLGGGGKKFCYCLVSGAALLGMEEGAWEEEEEEEE